MAKLFELKGVLQNYAWGGTEFIPNLLGTKPDGNKVAEYWLGAHQNAPSIVKTEKGSESLDSFLAADTSEKLGKQTADTFGRLPFLFKVLDVYDMLSIQVHPTKVEAEKGFAYENEIGIPLTASNRNYKDDNHKPEIMVALSEFWLLHGFLSKEKLSKCLNEVPEFNVLVPVFETEGYFGLYKKVMEQSQEETNEMLQSLIDRILPKYLNSELDKAHPDYWAAKAVDSSSDKSILDKGIFSIYFFNIVRLEKGEAIFQDAGIPHAYIEGQNMELMANSDNVLRGGLTPKHVDIPELLKHVKFEETIPDVLNGELQENGLERIFKSPAPDFELSVINLSASEVYQKKVASVEIVFLLDGEVTIADQSEIIKLKKGESALVTASCNYNISTSKNSTLYKATVNI